VRRFMLVMLGAASLCIGLPAEDRGPVPGDHTKVPPARIPSLYMSAADIQAGLDKLDPKLSRRRPVARSVSPAASIAWFAVE
jgi:hypothetical protein